MDNETRAEFVQLHKNIANLTRQIEHINRMLSDQRRQKAKDDKWLTADAVKTLTGWDGRFLTKARNQGLIKTRHEGKATVRYLLSSVEDLKSKLPK